MKADEFKVTTVLTWKQRFVVPLYQRQYQWHDTRDGNRTAAFWRDVAAKATDVLDGRARFEHYMGALLLAPGAASPSFGTTPQMQVVDGQQRLTTFLILIAAIREEARTRGFMDLVTQCEIHLFTTPGPTEVDEVVRYKLTPTPVDRDVFISILNGPTDIVRKKFAQYYWGGSVPKNTKYRSLRAFEYFLAQVREFVDGGPTDDVDVDIDQSGLATTVAVVVEAGQIAQTRLSSLLEALVFHLKLIVITFGEEDDAQVIFETLNSAGQPLLAMDLVRNNIFHRAEAQHRDSKDPRAVADKLYRDIWEPFDDGWWRDTAPNARPNRPRIDHFLSHVLTAETGQRTTVRELYAEYRVWATPRGKPRFEAVEEELHILERHAPTYEALEGRRDGDAAVRWIGERLRVWQNTTAYPVVFQIAIAELESDTKWAIMRLLDSYLTRRALCDLTPKNLNQVFARLAAAINERGANVEVIASFFRGLRSPSVGFPNDTELRNSIRERPIYGRVPSRVLVDVLWAVEQRSRTPKTENSARPQSLWVEHIMPQSWETHWALVDSNGQPLGPEDPKFRARANAVHTLGNLTIVTSALNVALSNSPFSQKKEALFQHSNLSINKKLTESLRWDEATIRQRGDEIGKLAVEIWPDPEIVGSMASRGWAVI